MNCKRRSRVPRRFQLTFLEHRLAPAGLNGLVNLAEPTLYSETAGGNLIHGSFSAIAAPQISSADGRYVAFTSGNGNLVPGQQDSNADLDVFLMDRMTNTTTLVSRKAGSIATTGKYGSQQPSISADGRFVAFQSAAQDLVSNATFPSYFPFLHPTFATHVYLWDRLTGESQLVSRRFDDPLVGASHKSYGPEISTNGDAVAFTSYATDLVGGYPESGPKSKFQHHYVFDRLTGTNTLVDHKFGVPNAPTTATFEAIALPKISANGRYALYVSRGSDLTSVTISSKNDLYRFDRITGINELVSAAEGSTSIPGNDRSGASDISADGRWIAMSSSATNLVPGYSGSGFQVYLKDMDTGLTTLISHNNNDDLVGGNGASAVQTISSDGRFVTLISLATDLLPGFVDGNGSTFHDGYLYDRLTDQMTLATRKAGTANTGVNDLIGNVRISANGGIVVYASWATDAVAGFVDGSVGNLISGDPYGFFSASNLFAFNPADGQTTLVSSRYGSSVTSGNLKSQERFDVSADGKFVFYATVASDVVSGLRDTNGAPDIYVRDLTTHAASPISLRQGAPSLSAGGASDWVQLSADGRYSVFTSTATNLVPGQIDKEGTNDVFLRDRVLGTTILVSRAAGTTATAGDDQSGMPVISADGRYVAFGSYAGNLIEGFVDNNGPSSGSQGLYNNTDVFLFDRITNSMTLVSREVGTTNIGANGTSGGFNAAQNSAYYIAMSADGNWITYRSDGKNLVNGFVDNDISGSADHGTNIYLFDRVNQSNRLVSHVPTSNTGGGNRRSYSPKISGDGRFVTYWGESSNLIGGMTFGGGRNVFLYDRDADTNTLVSHAIFSPTQSGNGGSSEPVLSRDGRYVVYISAANNLLADQVDSNFQDDVFLYDRLTGVNTLVSHVPGAPNQAGNSYSDVYTVPNDTAISEDGRFIVFNSRSTDLITDFVPGYPLNNPRSDVYLYDRMTNSNTLVSRSAASSTAGANGTGSVIGGISSNGRFVYFHASGGNVIDGFTASGAGIILVFDRITGSNRLVTHTPGSQITGGNGHQAFPATISQDGSVIAYVSNSDNLVAADFNGFADAFAFSNAPEAKIIVNDGSAQRSVIRSLVVTFDQPVQINGNPAEAFSLSNGSVQLAFAGVGEFTSAVTITFSGPSTQFGSLSDGKYALKINASRIVGGGHLDGNGDGIGGDDYVFSFHRLFGDVDGDGRVGSDDFAAFKQFFNTPAMTFDFNNDGNTTADDFAEFRKRFGVAI